MNFFKATPKDIEDVVLVGRSMNLCPYFGTRAAVNLSEVGGYFFYPPSPFVIKNNELN